MSTQKTIIIAACILGLCHIANGYLIDYDTILKCTKPGTICTLHVEPNR